MSNRICKASAVLLLWLLWGCPLAGSNTAGQTVVGAEKIDFYVSPSGDDSWSGKLAAPDAAKDDGPFKTLVGARDAIRKLRQSRPLPKGGVTVHVRAGVYPLKATFELTAVDDGTASAPIIYRAYENEQVRLVGGQRVGEFSPVDGTGKSGRIEKKHRDKIFQTNLRTRGITEFGQLAHRGFGRPMYAAALELFFQDKPMQLARWPNRGWVKIAAVPAGKQSGKFVYEGDRPKRWAGADDIWLHGYWTQDWADSYEKVKELNVQTREISTYEPHG
ncbi:MAG: hypothetical protein ACYS74_23775 [Planctomycetota bacterium]|jgi:hypothetical protein